MTRGSSGPWLAAATVTLLAVGAGGCFGAAEQCTDCLSPPADAGPVLSDDAASDSPVTGGAAGTGGDVEPVAAGGNGGEGGAGTGTGAGGTGDTAMGGMGGSTGAGGGEQGPGGGGNGGNSTTGGTGTGAAGSGGVAMGGGALGGSALGGSATGGSSTNGGATGGGNSGGSAGGSSGIDPDLVLWYKFDESSGTAAADSAMLDGRPRNGLIATAGSGGTATFSTMKQVGSHALILAPPPASPTANGAYVVVPNLQSLAPGAVTLSVWVNLAVNTATQSWERIFDFGLNANASIDLTARAGDVAPNPLRFAITTSGHVLPQEQRLDGPGLLSPNVWHHVVVVLPAGSPYTGTLYLDGVAVATNATMTLHPADVGVTTMNWLGRSQFSNPYFNGSLDDFRIYRRALTASEVTALFGVR